MEEISREELKKLREEYPKGTRIELLKMDVQAPPIGTRGTVDHIDDVGSMSIRWDNGCGLNAVYGEDIVKKVKE